MLYPLSYEGRVRSCSGHSAAGDLDGTQRGPNPSGHFHRTTGQNNYVLFAVCRANEVRGRPSK